MLSHMPLQASILRVSSSLSSQGESRNQNSGNMHIPLLTPNVLMCGYDTVDTYNVLCPAEAEILFNKL